MIKINDKNTYCPFYEYLYLFVMVIYMGQMTPETSRMAGVLSGDQVPFLIPIVMTLILLFRHPISFLNKKLMWLSAIMLCWTIAVCYKLNDFSSANLSYYFFLFYAIIIAYIHVRIYGRDLFLIYEHIMVVFSAISLVLWGISAVFPFTDSIFHLFPETQSGNNVLYLFNWVDPEKKLTYYFNFFTRNAGCSWEPGRFAIMLIPAILVNLMQHGVKFRKNKKVKILLAALATTFSTTGYSIVILLYAIFWFNKLTMKNVFSFLFIALPICIYLFSLDFMGSKIQERMDYDDITEQRSRLDYYEENYGDEYVASLDRFESASLDYVNYQQDPLLGYGRNKDHSWFRQEVTENFELTGGLVKTFSQYGTLVGLLLYSLLFFSSIKISRQFKNQRRFTFAIALLLCSVSYVVFSIPIFTAFWLYGLFCYKEGEKNRGVLKLKRRAHLRFRV